MDLRPEELRRVAGLLTDQDEDVREFNRKHAARMLEAVAYRDEHNIKAPPFKVGDIVRVLYQSQPYHKRLIGKVGEVTMVGGGSAGVCWDEPESEGCGHYVFAFADLAKE